MHGPPEGDRDLHTIDVDCGVGFSREQKEE